MRVAAPGRPHLSYCTNIHPGESLEDVRRALTEHVVHVKSLMGIADPFGVGLRLSARAANDLAKPSELASFGDLLVQLGLYVFTINGFPYGAFHGQRVKDAVYRPDWLEQERVLYTDRLAHILGTLIPKGSSGSISTVPGAFRERASVPRAARTMADRILLHAATLYRLRENTGKLVELALEPEPCCFLETTDDTVRFFGEQLFARAACRRFAELSGISPLHAEEFLRRHVGVCLDACHLAVEFEDARKSVSSLRQAGIRIGKIQVTTALRAELSGDTESDERTLRALERFADGVYLHQVVERSSGALVRHLDLPDAIAARRKSERPLPAEWRIHFHVPVFAERLEPFTSTQPFLRDLLELVRTEPVTEHLEVETYTWDVLPEEHRESGVDVAIARELAWTLERIESPRAATDAQP